MKAITKGMALAVNFNHKSKKTFSLFCRPIELERPEC